MALLALLPLLIAPVQLPPAPASRPASGVRFAVLGHIRGDPTEGVTNRLLPELLDDVVQAGRTKRQEHIHAAR